MLLACALLLLTLLFADAFLVCTLSLVFSLLGSELLTGALLRRQFLGSPLISLGFLFLLHCLVMSLPGLRCSFLVLVLFLLGALFSVPFFGTLFLGMVFCLLAVLLALQFPFPCLLFGIYFFGMPLLCSTLNLVGTLLRLGLLVFLLLGIFLRSLLVHFLPLDGPPC